MSEKSGVGVLPFMHLRISSISSIWLVKKFSEQFHDHSLLSGSGCLNFKSEGILHVY